MPALRPPNALCFGGLLLSTRRLGTRTQEGGVRKMRTPPSKRLEKNLF